MSSFLAVIFLLLSFGLSIYSYSQVDLNLTLSSNKFYLSFQSALTNLGYYQRPLSTLIYIVIVTLMLCVYFWLIYQAKIKKYDTGKYIKIALISSILLFLAYPAFSYDIFNYIFDARILVHHQQNPYLFTALDFPDDLWTRFMHWTHRTYPYGPTWLPLTSAFYLIGFDKFILTLWSFKLLSFLSYWLGALGVYWILKEYDPKNLNLGLVLYLFNPLILIEALVSGHLDSPMMGLMLFGLALALRGKKVVGWVGLVISIGIKYVSGALAPILLLFHLKKVSYYTMILMTIVLAYVLTGGVISQREILPWYFLVPFGLTVLIPKQKQLTKAMLSLTPALLVRYAPYLYVGEYTQYVKDLRNLLTVIIGISVWFTLSQLSRRIEKTK